jgi:Uma2 family endonuclease
MATHASSSARASMSVMSTPAGFVPLHTSAPRSRVEWELEDGETVPQSSPHNRVIDRLYHVLVDWVRVDGIDANVERDIALRWDEDHPKVGVDPDVAVFSPATPNARDLLSVTTWRAGHHPPILAIEVVSESNARKDYAASPEKYAANGTEELWVLDPKLVGPHAGGGPFPIQVWVRSDDGGLERVYAGAGPARSPRLSEWGREAWIVVQGGDPRIASDRLGQALWLTGEERERSEKERERSEKERERSEKERALARIAELERELAAKRGPA